MSSVKHFRGLYLITPSNIDAACLRYQVAMGLKAGAKVVQYRQKNPLCSDLQRFEQARMLQQLCKRYGALFIVNDSLSLALAVGADGLHIGRNDAALDWVLKQARGRLYVGVSCYSDIAYARVCAQMGASYVAFGACFSSVTKPQAPLVSKQVMARGRRFLADVPIVGVGGITLSNAVAVLRCGVDMVAVSSDIFHQKHLAWQVRRYQNYWN